MAKVVRMAPGLLVDSRVMRWMLGVCAGFGVAPVPLVDRFMPAVISVEGWGIHATRSGIWVMERAGHSMSGQGSMLLRGPALSSCGGRASSTSILWEQ